MKKSLYLMRHGETLFNQQKKIQGWCDSPLTSKGQQQALIAKKYFETQGIVFKEAYSSTSERACDTLELVTDAPYTRIKGLKEWNFGTFEAEHEYLNPKLPYGDFFAAYGGEKESDFRIRVANTVSDILSQALADPILIVSHGAACRQFMHAWEHKSLVEQKSRIGNCCILKFEYDEDEKEFELLEIINHDFSHLEEV